jgi:hypothetical protein
VAVALGALDLVLEQLPEARAVGQPGHLVGHRLLRDQLVQLDVLQRDRRLAGEVAQHVALGGVERRPDPGDRHHGAAAPRATRTGQGLSEGECVPAVGLG